MLPGEATLAEYKSVCRQSITFATIQTNPPLEPAPPPEPPAPPLATPPAPVAARPPPPPPPPELPGIVVSLAG